MKPVCYLLLSFMVVISSFGQQKDINDSHYVFPEFTKGSILMNDGLKYDVFLNYNSLTEEMIFETDGKKLAVSPNDIGTIDTVYIKDRKFIQEKGKIVELLYHSKWEIYAEYKCRLKEKGKPIGYGQRSKTTSITNYSSFSGWDKVYDLKLPEIYEIEAHTIYWLKKNGELGRFSNIRDLKKRYKDKKDLFKAYVKTHKVNFENQESIIQLIEHLESNN